MPIQKLILLCIVFASALLGSVLAADKPAKQADVDARWRAAVSHG